MMPRGELQTTLCMFPSFFWGIIQVFLPMPLKTQSNQIALCATAKKHSVFLRVRVSISLRVHAHDEVHNSLGN
jgi:hypothetical protein